SRRAPGRRRGGDGPPDPDGGVRRPRGGGVHHAPARSGGARGEGRAGARRADAERSPRASRASAGALRALGVDVGVRRGLDAVLLDETLAPIEVHRRLAPEDLSTLAKELEPDVVAIDAPPAWGRNGRPPQ